MSDFHLFSIISWSIIALSLSATAFAGEDHEYHSIEWIILDTIDVPQLEFKNANDSLVTIQSIFSVRSPSVMIISFMAEWCKNCRHEAPFINDIYTKYKDSGLGLVVIMEYSSPEGASAFLNKYQFKMPVLFGDLTSKDKLKKNSTRHSQIRSIINDPRTWGTPFHIILDKSDPNRIGLIPGEIKRDELRAFLRKKLKL